MEPADKYDRLVSVAKIPLNEYDTAQKNGHCSRRAWTTAGLSSKATARLERSSDGMFDYSFRGGAAHVSHNKQAFSILPDETEYSRTVRRFGYGFTDGAAHT